MEEKTLQFPYLSELRDGDGFEGFYVVRDSSLQTAVNGKSYIRMSISDASGSVTANVWDANRELFLSCPAGSLLKIQGIAESYRGKPQIKIIRFRPAHESEVDMNRFLPKSSFDIDAMRIEFLGMIDLLKDSDYRILAEAFFLDAKLMDRFARAPAAREVHHAWIGGLLEHTLNVAHMASDFSGKARINGDLLLVGALLHDIGKIDELSAKFSVEYTDRGKLLGHLCIGSEMVAEKAGNIPDYPREKMFLVQHLILSHHGRYEYGSPVLPKVPEAFALHYLDNLDAKVETANRLIDSIQDPEKQWTEYSRTLETALYRESAREAVEPDE